MLFDQYLFYPVLLTATLCCNFFFTYTKFENVGLNCDTNIFEENKKDIKKSWIILKRIIGKHNDKTNFPNEFHINNTRITDKKINSKFVTF